MISEWVWFSLEITGPCYRRDIDLVQALEILSGQIPGGELAEGSFLVHTVWAEGSWGQLSRTLSFEQKELWEKDKSRL